MLHVIDSLSISGGAERQLVANLRAFDHEAMTHHVAVLRNTPDDRTGDLPESVRVWSIGQGDTPPSLRAAVSRLRRLITDEKIDVVHASLPDSAMAARIAGLVSRTPVVESLVNISHEDIRTVDNPAVTRRKLRLHTLVDWLTTRRVSRFHAVSQAVADSWAATVRIPRSKMKVIPRSIDLPSLGKRPEEGEARVSVRDEFGFPEDTFVVVAVGRQEPQKGHRYLLEAAASLRGSIPHARYLIVGRGGNASTALERKIAELGIGDIVIMTGSRRDIPRLLAAADVFAFPSLFEGNGGNAMIEALALGKAVITTDAPPMTDLVPGDPVGLLVPRMDSEALAEAIVRLADDEMLRHRLEAGARERAAGFPAPEEITSRYESLYREILDDGDGDSR